MEKDLIVAIFVPTKARRKSTTGEPTAVVGTGYPVADDLILTSRHVVRPKNRDPNAPILLRWFYGVPGGGEPAPRIEIANDDLVWIGKGDLDAALIRCPRPKSLSAFSVGRLVDRAPREGERWSSSGFARASKNDDLRFPGEFGGTVRQMAQQAAFFELIEDVCPDTADKWGGVSGMPVFVGQELLGLVKHVPPNFRGHKLGAVPAWRLFQDAEFVKHLGITEESQRRLERMRAILLRVLGQSGEVARELAEALGLARGNADVPGGREQIVEQLLNSTPPLEHLFDMVLGIQDKHRRAQDRSGARAAADIILALLPAIQQASALDSVEKSRGNPAACMVPLPTKLRTLAEIIMAGADLRVARLRPAATPLGWPEGEPSLPEPPESGRDADGKQFSRDWRAHLIETFANDPKGFRNAFQDYLKIRFLPSDLRSPYSCHSEGELLKTVAVQLRQDAEAKDKLTYYFIASLPEDPKEREAREAVLADLKAEFPYIAFLRLAGSEALDAEVGRFGRLREVLYEEAGHKT